MEKERKIVERQFSEISLKLADTEATIKLLHRMCRQEVATNDVFNFTRKQTGNRKSTKRFDIKILKTSMRQKLNDACAQANRRRQIKNILRRKLR